MLEEAARHRVLSSGPFVFTLCSIKSGVSESHERVDRWRVKRLVGLFGGCRVRILVVIAKAALVVVSRAHLVLSQEASSRLAAHRRLRRSLMVLLEDHSSEAARHRVFSPEGYTTSSQARQRVRQHLVISCVAQESCRSDVLSALQAAHRCIRKLVAVEERRRSRELSP